MRLSLVVFNRHHTDLIGLSKGSLTENIAISTEKFICKIYGVPEVDTFNKARVKLYCIGRTQETLPPTSDAAKFHIMRSHYQASVWNQAHSSSSDRNSSSSALYEGVPQPTLQLQENSYGMHVACNCRKLGDNCCNTHEDQE